MTSIAQPNPIRPSLALQMISKKKLQPKFKIKWKISSVSDLIQSDHEQDAQNNSDSDGNESDENHRGFLSGNESVWK